MGKLTAFVDLFRKGSEVTDPVLWKNRGAAVVAVTAVIYALLRIGKAYGYEIDLSAEDVGGIAVGVVTAVSLFSNFATSKKVGLLAPKPGADDGVQDGPAASPTGPGDMHGNP